MSTRVVALSRGRETPLIDAVSVLEALSAPVLVVGAGQRLAYVNPAGEEFLNAGRAALESVDLGEWIPADSPLFALIEQARRGVTVAESGVVLESPRIGRHLFNVQASPIAADLVAVVLHERSIAETIDRQLTHRAAARSVGGMAAMLAHEIKNPLSGIRGAAQLLEETAAPADRALTRLIREETDRICALVDRVEIFADGAVLRREPVNIHEVLDRVHQLARNGFGRHVRFVETYDPSLPPVLGNRDQLVQVFLNLVKNAAEAVALEGGEIVLATAYRHGVRLAVPGTDSRVHLPLMVSVQDNGAGIPEAVRPYLFDPFVTSKPRGSGLGLALVAKIVGDHGGVVEFESRPRRTVFRVMLPLASGKGPAAAEGVR